MPEAAAAEKAVEAERGFAADVVRAETEVRDLEREVKRLEGDVETVRSRAARDQQRLDAGGITARETTGLQHEMQSLARRQSDLEDQELELMEQLETAEAALDEAREGQQAARAGLERAQQLRDDALADIADGTAQHEAARAGAAARIPADLLALYERIRTPTRSDGAAGLQG